MTNGLCTYILSRAFWPGRLRGVGWTNEGTIEHRHSDDDRVTALGVNCQGSIGTRVYLRRINSTVSFRYDTLEWVCLLN